MRLPICLILGLLLFSAPATAFQPHADCTFNKIDPLPKMDDCAHLERRVKSIKNNMASAQRAMDKLREAHGDAIDDLWEQGPASSTRRSRGGSKTTPAAARRRRSQ